MGRGQAATMERRIGTVKNVVTDRGFGFIKVEDGGPEFFFHYSGCLGVRFEDLRQGSRVSFVPGTGAKGPRAEQIELA